MILEDIGGGDNALFCMTNLTACCHDDNNGRSALGDRKSVRFIQNQRSDGAWYICTLERWRGWNLPLWDTWCNACYPDHIHWIVLSNHRWVTVVMLQKVRFKHDRVYCMWCHKCQYLYQCKTTIVISKIYHICSEMRPYMVYVSIHSMTTLRREDIVTW